MPFSYIKAGTALLHPIPENAVNHARYLPGNPGWAVNAAGGQRTYTRAQEPEKTPDVVSMRMAQENISHLMSHPRRHTPRITKIEQQAATLVDHLQLE